LVGSNGDLGRGGGVGSNGSEGYMGTRWTLHARAGGWGEVAALREVGVQGREGNGVRELWKVGAGVVGEVGRLGATGKVVPGSQRRWLLGGLVV